MTAIRGPIYTVVTTHQDPQCLTLSPGQAVQILGDPQNGVYFHVNPLGAKNANIFGYFPRQCLAPLPGHESTPIPPMVVAQPQAPVAPIPMASNSMSMVPMVSDSAVPGLAAPSSAGPIASSTASNAAGAGVPPNYSSLTGQVVPGGATWDALSDVKFTGPTEPSGVGIVLFLFLCGFFVALASPPWSFPIFFIAVMASLNIVTHQDVHFEVNTGIIKSSKMTIIKKVKGVTTVNANDLTGKCTLSMAGKTSKKSNPIVGFLKCLLVILALLSGDCGCGKKKKKQGQLWNITCNNTSGTPVKLVYPHSELHELEDLQGVVDEWIRRTKNSIPIQGNVQTA